MKTIVNTVLFILLAFTIQGQSIEDSISMKDMRKDLEIFKKIRIEANSGLYKHRTKTEIDSIWRWADRQIEHTTTYREFYNILCKITDFEGSCHNHNAFPKKKWETISEEKDGYFPIPIKWIDGKWLVNSSKSEMTLGAEILFINGEPISNIIKRLYKYSTTDGYNLTYKRVAMRSHFSKFYRFEYGKQDLFLVDFINPGSKKVQSGVLKSIGFKDYYKRFKERHSQPIDGTYYKKLSPDEKYSYKKLNEKSGKLTINSFAIGANAEDPEHLRYTNYLDSIFTNIKTDNIQNLIIDIRFNSGGNDPSELVPYEYLTYRDFKENKSGWISFRKVPMLKYVDSHIHPLLRPFGVKKYNRYFKKAFPIEKNGRYFEGPDSINQKIRKRRLNAFNGHIYLIINPEVASAASNFASLVACNDNVTIVGEESCGGYYGHNGHSSITYILPKTKIETTFSIVNLKQYVIEKEKQPRGRGIIPDIEVHQTFNDFINNRDTQMEYVYKVLNINQ